MKLIIVAMLAAMTVGCSAFNETPNRRVVDDCRNCYYYYGSGPSDTISQTMWR